MDKLFQKIIAIMLVITLMGANLIVLGMYSITYALGESELEVQDNITENHNVEFNAYLEGGGHVIVASTEGEGVKTYLNINVKNSGYLKDATIQFEDVNFKLAENIENEYIQSIDIQNCSIALKQINNGSNVTIEIPVVLLDTNSVPVDNFAKESKVVFHGTYVDAGGKENSVSKEIVNKISWNRKEVEVSVDAEIVKYIPYVKDEIYGVMVQAKVNSKVVDSKLPVKETNIAVTAPEIDGIKPAKVFVSANYTKSTNGKNDGIDFKEDNYNYDVEQGVVNIQVRNDADENGQISWMKDAQDEYLVTFVFDGKEAYDAVVDSGINSKVKVQANVSLYNNEELIVEAPAVEKEIQMDTALGTISDFSMSAVKKLAKGNVYANYDATDEKREETDYWVKYSATINNLDLTDNIEFEQGIDTFVREDGQEGLTTIEDKNYAYNKEISISEEVFNKILGEEGYIEILDENENIIAQINKETEKDDNGNYIIDLSEFNNNQLVIRTSKPISVGKITIEVKKAISKTIDYSKKQMQDFIVLRTKLEGKADTSTIDLEKDIELKEVKSVAQVEVSKKDLSTVVENKKVELRASLDTSSIYNALYKEPTLKFTLPSSISQVRLNNAKLLMENGLKIKKVDAKMDESCPLIIVELEGTQTEYTTNAEYKGTILVIEADITIKELTPNSTAKIEMEFTNKNELSTNKSGKVETDINFIAPAGVVAANGISNYADNAKQVLSITDEKATAEIDTYADQKVATITGKVINNYDNEIEDVVILGRLPAKDNKKIDTSDNLGSTFDAKLSKPIEVSGIEPENYTIYYSDKTDATKELDNDDNQWSTNVTANSKSYMIITNNYEMRKGEVIDFNYNVEIPANLTYNNSSYEMYKVYYNNVSSIGKMAEYRESAILGAETGTGPELEVNLEPIADTIREGQIVKMKVTVKNTGSVPATNAKINLPIPEHTNYVRNETVSGFYDMEDKEVTIDLGTIKPGEIEELPFYIRINKNIDSSTKPEDEVIAEIPCKLTIITDEVPSGIPSNECVLKVLQGKIGLEMTSDIEEGAILTNNQNIEYMIYVENISGIDSLQNVMVNIPIHEGMEYKSAVIKEHWYDEEESGDPIIYNQENNAVQINIDTLSTMKVITLKLQVKEFTGKVSMMTMATADSTGEHYSNIIDNVAEIIDLEVSELTATPKYIKEGETVTYKLSITNKGKAEIYNIEVNALFPEELAFIEGTYTYGETANTVSTLTNNSISIFELKGGETTEITLTAKARLLEDKNDKTVETNFYVGASNFEAVKTNTVSTTIEYDEELHEQQENPSASDKYKISGTAWLDSNKDGKRDQDEQLLSGITVKLLYKKDNTVVKDSTTNEEMTATTDSNGMYQFDNVLKGEYLVAFLYDASRYSITTYQADGIDEGENSDAIDINMTIDGQRRIAGITNVITIKDSNVRDIDIGLYVSEKFDLRIDKYVSKITRTTPTAGTNTFNYSNEKVAKIEVLGSNVGQSNVAIEYKIVVTNEGAIAGYAKKIVDYIPQHTNFSTELNKNWYLSENGNIYNSSLENEIINPGESKELTLILTARITEESLGNLNNNAEIYESYNEQGIPDIDSTPGNKASDEDDISGADVIISIVTGNGIIYVTLALGVIVLLGFAIYEIKKRVLIKTKEKK